MTVNDILQFLDSKYPLSLAAEFDNCGLLIGDKNTKVKSGVIALDCTAETIEFAKEIGANLIVTHHPIMFSGIKKIPADSIEYRLISNGISLISMHTNLDVAAGGVNDCLCSVLGLKNVKRIPTDDFYIRIGEIESISPDAFAKSVSLSLNTTVKYVAGKSDIKKVGVCSGSGGEYIDFALKSGADAFVSADIKHHLFIDAENRGYTLIDAGHRATEEVVIETLEKQLNGKFGGFKVFYSKTIKFA